MEVMMGLPSEIGKAIVKAIQAKAAAWSALGVTGTTLHAEYTDLSVREWVPGNAGRVIVRLAGTEVLQAHEASALVAYTYDVQIDTTDINSAADARGSLLMALTATLGNEGDAVWPLVVDTDNDRLGGSGRLTVEQSTLIQSEDVDRPMDLATLRVEIWQKHA